LKKLLAASLSPLLLLGVFPALAFGSPATHTQSVASGPLLAELVVAEESFSSSYNRSAFKHWTDADSNGCDTRREVLASESKNKTTCRTLAGGSWVSVYDNAKTTNSSSFDVDHMVPLKEAWESGAYAWDSNTRASFANDLNYPHSLIAVSAKSNRSKSDRDPNNWMPPASSFQCQYVGRWIAVKYRWSLTVDPAEKNYLTGKVASCGSAANVIAPPKALVAIGPAPVAKPSPTPTQAGIHPKFSSCAEAERNGYRGPYIKGINPEYAWYQDRDKDGVVCE